MTGVFTTTSDPYTAELVLRQGVPAFYLAACLYFGLEIGGRTKLRYSMGFGVIGMIGYLALNEPSWPWLPAWSSQLWTILGLAALLGIGIWLFGLVIEREGLDWPWERVIAGWRWVRDVF